MKDEKFPHTRKPLHWRRLGVAGGKLRSHRGEHSKRVAEGKVERLSHRGSVPTSTHQPERLVCSPDSRTGWGLGAEAWASEVRSQGEDWGWLHEHSLKRASAPQLARRSLRKRLELPKKQETIVSRYARRGDSELRLNKLQKRMQAVAISVDPKDGHEMLRLLLPPPRSLCASTGHSPHLPSWEPVQPPLPGTSDPGTTSPGEHKACLRLVQHHDGLCRRRLTPHSVPLLPPRVSQNPLISCYFNSILSERRTDTLRRPTRRGGAKSKAEPQELCEQRREREISPSSLRSSGLELHNQLAVTCIFGISE